MAKDGASGNRKEYAYHLLKDRLVNCIYKPDTILNETQLATDLGLSRTPIREALHCLEQDGLVRIVPKKGIYVTDITIQDILFVFQTRVEIEPISLKMAGPYLNRQKLKEFSELFRQDQPDLDKAFWEDMDMHIYLVGNCGNPFIIDMMQKVFAQSCRIVIASKQNTLKVSSARREHEAILEALLEERFDQAADLLREHLETCKNYSLNYFSSLQTKAAISPWQTWSARS